MSGNTADGHDAPKASMLSNFTVGSGLLEIAALTTLIGSSTAELLALGTQGLVGLPWACMSAFGSLSIVRTCIVGASSDWVRETLGVSTARSDSSLGVKLDLTSNLRGASRVKREATDPKGIICKSNMSIDGAMLSDRSSRQDVYVFDQRLSLLLGSVPSSEPGGPLKVYGYANTYDIPKLIGKYEWLTLGASLIKLIEPCTFWYTGSYNLAWTSSLSYLYFFVGALVLMIIRFYDRKPESATYGPLDLLAGQLPTPMRPGGPRKIFLGAQQSRQEGVAWRLIWAPGAIVTTASLFFTYINLSQSENNTVFTWAGFQVVWLLARLVFHHFANFNFPPERRMITELPPLDTLGGPQKHRILDLALAVAQYQTLVHPRGAHSYQEDLLAVDVIKTQLKELKLSPFYAVHESLPASTTFDIWITHIIGDTALNSAAWLSDSKLGGMDLYDACIVLFHDGHDTYAVPSVRALSGKSIIAYSDSETGRGAGQKVPKGAGNLGWGIEWLFWIPCGESGWMVTQSDQMKTIGMRKAEIMTDAQVTRRLGFNDFQISLSDAEEVRVTAKYAMEAAKILRSFLPNNDKPLISPSASTIFRRSTS